MTISEIYKKYQINKGLQEHMIRVASVAKIVCDNSTVALDTRNTVSACLLHDLGNLIKANNMAENSSLYEPEGVVHWQKVQEVLIRKYGPDAHVATDRMVAELDLSENTKHILSAIGNDVTRKISERGTLEEKIANYSDMRVGLHGIIGMSERMNDIRNRYTDRADHGYTSDSINIREQLVSSIEQDIFSHSTIKPTDVTDESTKDVQKELWNWTISA